MRIESEQFKTERLKAGLSKRSAADLLGVTPRTVRSWETGHFTAPFAAFKLLRILRGYALPGDAWHGFVLRGDTLYSPEGRAFKREDLAWWSLTCAMARAFRVRYAAAPLPVSLLDRAAPSGGVSAKGGVLVDQPQVVVKLASGERRDALAPIASTESEAAIYGFPLQPPPRRESAGVGSDQVLVQPVGARSAPTGRAVG